MSKGADTRHAILQDALAQASVRGLEGLTIGSLAKSLGMSKSGLYAHFDSKEALQLKVLDEARDQFVAKVVMPALQAPRGEPRVVALFERWLVWEGLESLPGGCPFVAVASELDDQPGPVRDRLVEVQRDWVDTLSNAARISVQQGHFRADLDVAQFAYEIWGLVLGYHWYARLLARDDATARLRLAFTDLLGRSRAPAA